METQRNPNEPIKPTATGQEGSQSGGSTQERDHNKKRDHDKQGDGSQEREREKQGGGSQQRGGSPERGGRRQTISFAMEAPRRSVIVPWLNERREATPAVFHWHRRRSLCINPDHQKPICYQSQHELKHLLL
jgi:hypothetical protein